MMTHHGNHSVFPGNRVSLSPGRVYPSPVSPWISLLDEIVSLSLKAGSTQQIFPKLCREQEKGPGKIGIFA